MQRYMKSEMPYLGVASPGQREAFREVFPDVVLPKFELWESAVLALWWRAEYREERYAAIALSGERRYRGFQDTGAMALYEEMIVTGAWWDYVDAIAIHRIGPILVNHSQVVGQLMIDWADDPHMWKRRTAIICQVLAKDECDAGLLMACIEPNLGDRRFFIRKAIGWALRDFAKLNPDSARIYVDENRARLSALSRREAEKGIARAERAAGRIA